MATFQNNFGGQATGEEPAANWNPMMGLDDEQHPDFGKFQTLPSPDWAKEPTKPFTIGGAPSPAQLLEAAGPDAVLNRPAATTPAPGTPAAVGNPTAAPPPTSTGSNLPAFGAQYNAAWMSQGAITPGMPGAGTSYQGPQGDWTAGLNNVPGYNPNQNNAATWSTDASWQDRTYGATPVWNGTSWQQPRGNSDAAYNALQQVLGGDASGMDTSAMKNRYKEQALQMEKDQMGKSRQAAAGRGMLDSGYQSSQERRIGGDTRKNILANSREVDIAAADASVKNRLAGSEALNSILTGDTGREKARVDTITAAEDARTAYGLDAENKRFTGQLDADDRGFQNKLGLSNDRFDAQQTAAEFEDKQAIEASKQALEVEKTRLDALVKQGQLTRDAADSELRKFQAGEDSKTSARDQDMQLAQQKTTELIARLGLAVNLEQIKNASMRDKSQFLVDIFGKLVEQEQANAQLGLGYTQNQTQIQQLMLDAAKSVGVA